MHPLRSYTGCNNPAQDTPDEEALQAASCRHSWAHASSCAGTSTFVRGQISMRMTRKMGSTRPLWQRSRPWDPRALPRGWSTLSWALALHSELPQCLAPGLFVHMRRDVSSLWRLWALLARCKGAFHGPLRCDKGGSVFSWAVAVQIGLPLACFSCIAKYRTVCAIAPDMFSFGSFTERCICMAD